MCEWGDTVTVRVFIPADLSRTGAARWTDTPIDSCIAPLVRALQLAGIVTRASCCGHGRRPGNIALADGRELIIAADFEVARVVDNAFPPIAEVRA
jgi:hypothetical protein